VSKPRQASRPRAGSGPRAPGAARTGGTSRQGSQSRAGSGPRAPDAARTGGTSRQAGRGRAPARASHEPATAVAELADHGSDSVAGTKPRAPSDELSSWQRLLYQLNALLRDPTLTRALARSFAKLTAGVRDLSAATRDAIRRLAQAVRRLRIPFPRRVLLGLLALTLPFALLALLLNSSDDKRPAPSARDQPSIASAGALGGSPPSVAMPDVRPDPARVPKVRVAMVLDRTYDAATLRRELRALGTWLAVNHAPGTRVSVIDARSARASRPARGAQLAGVRPERQRPSTAAAIRSAFGQQRERRLLVTLGTAAPSSTASTLRIATRRGAATASSTPVGRSRRSRATIDDRRPNALAASVARGIMAVSGQRELR
jgi:hypothetical protein